MRCSVFKATITCTIAHALFSVQSNHHMHSFTALFSVSKQPSHAQLHMRLFSVQSNHHIHNCTCAVQCSKQPSHAQLRMLLNAWLSLIFRVNHKKWDFKLSKKTNITKETRTPPFNCYFWRVYVAIKGSCFEITLYFSRKSTFYLGKQ